MMFRLTPAIGFVLCLTALMIGAQPPDTPSDLALTPPVELSFSQAHIFQEMAQQLGLRVALSPGVQALSLRASVSGRPAEEVLRAAREVTGLQWCLREGPEGEEELYLWLPPDRLTEAVILRGEDQHRYAAYLRQNFETALHPASEARRQHLERNLGPTIAAAQWWATFPPEVQEEILRYGLAPRPFGELPAAVQEALIKGFARSLRDPRTILRADGSVEEDPAKLKFVDPKIYLNDRTRMGFTFSGTGRKRRLRLTVQTPFDKTGKLHIGSDGQEEDRRFSLGVGKLMWNRYPGNFMTMPQSGLKDTRGEDRLDEAVSPESLPDLLLGDSEETPSADGLRTGREGMLRRFQWLSENSKRPFLIQLPLGETEVLFPEGDPVAIDAWYQLFDEIAMRLGYTWTSRGEYLLWQHQEWYQYTDPTVPREFVEAWAEAARGNQGPLPLNELASLAAASGDQLQWLREQGEVPVPEKLFTCGRTRALLIFYATLSAGQRELTETPGGLEISPLTPAQVKLLEVVPDLLHQTPGKAFEGTLQVEDRMQAEGKVVFRFHEVTGRVLEAPLTF